MAHRSEASVEIAAPPERVFEWLVDPGLNSRWHGIEIEWLPADRGALRRGYRGVEVEPLPDSSINPRMRPAPTEVEVTRYEPPFAFDARFAHRFATAETRHRLEVSGIGTRLRLATSWRYHGLTRLWMVLARLRGVSFGKVHGEAVTESLRKLKGLVEAG
ncbi:MAG TPA: SRPBCC family protein [Solirubrobacterales bacterium]